MASATARPCSTDRSKSCFFKPAWNCAPNADSRASMAARFAGVRDVKMPRIVRARAALATADQ
jgi:hypothetical protein